MNQLAIIEQPQVPAFSYSDIERIANAFAQSRMFGVSDPSAALSLCLLAQAEGQHPAIAFRDYSIIQGKPAKKAEAMQRDFLQSGGKIEWITLDDTCAKAKFSHPAGGTATIDWTMERARAANLGGKEMWKKYPRQMLRSRVISEGVRTVCPMATSGMYVPEEVADFEPTSNGAPQEHVSIETGEVIERQKVVGIHKIKERLSVMMKAGDQAEDLEQFRKLVHENRADIKAIRDANHEWWTGDGGDDFEGFGKWMERRYAELTPTEETLTYQLLVSTINECTSWQELQAWLAKHGDAVESLDGEESRRFEALYDERFAALKMVAEASA
jgi:hypothetical protein